MEGLQGHSHAIWNPLQSWGINHLFFNIHLDTVYTTWIILLFITIVIILVRPFIKKVHSVIFYGIDAYASVFEDLVLQSVGVFHYQHFAFITTLFTFIILCNWVAVVPGLAEPTADLNTTLALGLIAFFYKEFYAIKAHGWGGYLSEFIKPFFVMLPLNIIGHLSKVVSLSFRLFGNIFGGSIITQLWSSLLSNSLILNILGFAPTILITLFFVFFEGLIQAFVFTMLTITYIGMATQQEEEL